MRGVVVSLAFALFAAAPVAGQARASVGITLTVAAGMGVEVQEEGRAVNVAALVAAAGPEVEAAASKAKGPGGLRVSFPSDRLWIVRAREASGAERVVAAGSRAGTVRLGGGEDGRVREVRVTVVAP